MIVKVQRPVYTTESSMEAMLLVYDKDRTFDEFIPQTARVLALMGDDFKMYCRAHIDSEKRLVIDQRLPEQAW